MYGQFDSDLFSEGGLVSYFVAKGAFKFYFVERLNFEFISEGGFESYFVGRYHSNLFLVSNTSYKRSYTEECPSGTFSPFDMLSSLTRYLHGYKRTYK